MVRTADALFYEGDRYGTSRFWGQNVMHLDYSTDVMEIMTTLRRDWGLVYPEENKIFLLHLTN